jgi:hypothetical protein
MKRFAIGCTAFALLGISIATFSTSDTTAANLADEPTIKEVMHKVNDKGALKDMIAANIKGSKWDELGTSAKELVPLAKAMSKHKQPKGSDESWTKLAGGYAKAAEDLEKAAADKDAKLAQASLKTLTACGGCHSQHKPK